MHMHLMTLSPVRKAVAHARTASQPCHHPALARLAGGVPELRSWAATAASGGADGSSGLALVDAVLAALGEVLDLPLAAAALHGEACDGALDAFLVLADAYGEFEAALLAMRESAAEARVGARRGYGAAAAVAASRRGRRRAEKELRRLAAAMRHASSTPSGDATDGDGEVGGAVAEAAAAIAVASEAVFLGCAAMSPDMSAMGKTATAAPRSNKWLARLRVVPVTKKVSPETWTATEAAAALERLEERIGEMESGSEKVFRRLLQTRVSLLNIHNPL